MKLFVDFETYYSKRDNYCIRTKENPKGLSIAEYINDPRFKVFGAAVTDEEGKAIWYSERTLKACFLGANASGTTIVSHNIKFDGSILAWKYGVKPKAWVDTVGLAKATLGSSVASFSLKSLGEHFGLAPKGELKTDGLRELTKEQEEELAAYCLRDVEICREIYNKLAPQFPSNQWSILDWTARCFIEPKLVLNSSVAENVVKAIGERKENVFKTIGVDKKRLSSNQQFAGLLKEKGFKVPMKTNKNGKQIPALSRGDAGFLELMETKDPILKTLIDARIEAKQTMEVKRAEKLVAIGRNRLYPFDVVFSGATQTHRFSGGNGAGGNPQNFPQHSELRRAIEAPAGSALIVADFKQIELRILAAISGDPNLLATIAGGRPYNSFGERFYGFHIDKHENPVEYKFGKESLLGLGYQMGGDKFIVTVKKKVGIDIDKPTAWRTINLYRSTFKLVPSLWEKASAAIEIMASGQTAPFPGFKQITLEKNQLRLPSGLLVRFPGLRKEEGDKGKMEWVYDKYKSKKSEKDRAKIYGGKLVENICQALAGEVCKTAIQRLIDRGLDPKGQIHDELLVVCEEEAAEEAKTVIVDAMTEPLEWWKELLLDIEIGFGKNWLEAK